MGWLGDIAILGAVVIGGWWFLNNYKGSAPGSGGGALLPPAGGVPPLEEGTAPAKTYPPSPLAEAKHQLASEEQCRTRGSDIKGVKCKCHSVGTLKYVICDMPEAIKCALNCVNSTKATKETLKKLKVDKCNCNGERAQLEAALMAGTTSLYARAYLTNIDYAHNISRMRVPRAVNKPLFT